MKTLKTIQLKDRVVNIHSERLSNLITLNQSVDLKMDSVTDIYKATTLLGEKTDAQIDMTINYKLSNGETATDVYSLDFSGNVYGSMATRYGRLYDVIGVTNKTLYFAE